MFEKERGRNQAVLLDDPLMRKGVEQWMERVLGFYGEKGGGVDVELIDEQVILTAKSADYLYSAYTPREMRYQQGSRPMLEAVVRENVREGTSGRDKALALMRRVRDNRDQGLASPWLFYGGHEEDLLRRGALMCNEVSRLFVCLCQIAGLPARLHSSHISGHMMAEVLTDGKWGWVDSMKGMAPVKENGDPASAWELTQNTRLFERQPKSFWDDVRPPTVELGQDARDPRNLALVMAKARDCYFHPREAQALGNYFVWEHQRYTYPWRLKPADEKRLLDARHAEQLNRAKLGWPQHYYNSYLFDEPLKMRE